MSNKAARSEMFLRGAPSYVSALAALEAFEQGVEDMCRKVYARHKDRLLPAMGLDDGGDCERHAIADPAERSAEVGICRGTQKSGVNGPCFYVYLYFGESEDDEPEVLAKVWLDFPARRLRDEIYDQIRRKNPHCGIERAEGEDYWGLVLSSSFKLDDPASGPDEVLEKLLPDWIGYCESIGGLKMSER